jgi:hypothetical protein
MKTINKKLLPGILLIFVFLFAVQAQTVTTIQGVVKDSRTKKPIPFASVFVPEAQIGTVTNLDGFFTIKVDSELREKSFVISHLGYRMVRSKISDFLDSGRYEFFLESHTVLLDEVIVRPEDARKLVELAISKIEVNYPQYPNRLTGFYREAIKQRRDYISVIEAVVEVDQSAYGKNSTTDRVKIIQGRKSGTSKKRILFLLSFREDLMFRCFWI